jgi:hypothetical protein
MKRNSKYKLDPFMGLSPLDECEMAIQDMSKLMGKVCASFMAGYLGNNTNPYREGTLQWNAWNLGQTEATKETHNA